MTERPFIAEASKNLEPHTNVPVFYFKKALIQNVALQIPDPRTISDVNFITDLPKLL